MPEVYENLDAMQNYLNLAEYSFPFTDVMNNLGVLSPSNSSMDSQMTSSSNPSPLSVSASPSHTNTSTYITLTNAEMWGNPALEIIEQPVDKFRFRYKSEMMGTHGSLAGSSSTTSRKKQAPTVELRNHPGMAIIRCTLVTADKERRGPHAHRLVRRVGNSDEDDPHEIKVSPEIGFQASFNGMGIIHTAKKHIKEELVKKKRFLALEEAKRKNPNVKSLSVREETTIKMEAENAQKWMNLNSVVLCFQAFCPNNDGVLTPITEPVYSLSINNLKSALTGELKICRIDKTAGTCDGNDEIFMLVEKVGKKNIQIRFFDPDPDGQDDEFIWEDFGRFTELDVHHQYAIVFRTPPYKDRNITEPKEVYIQLCRKSDGDRSEPRKFTYKPNDRIISRKRPRLDNESNSSMLPIFDEVPHLPSPSLGSSSEFSAELNKIIDIENPPNSAELQEMVSKLDSDYFMHIPSLSNSESKLTLDGSGMKKDKISFAERIVGDIVKLIKSRDPKANERILMLLKERESYGDSPLHSALRHGQVNLVKCILMLLATSPEFKPIVNLQTSSGRTCLHYAVEQNQPEITKALLSLGADPNACDDHGVSPLHSAVKIPEAGTCVDILLERKDINVEAQDDAGWLALHLAAESGSLHAVKSLVKANVNVNSTDMSYGRTALHFAVEGGHKNIVEFLLKETKIDVNKQNFSGNTALHSAVINTGERARELCKILMKYNADPKIANNNNNRQTMKVSRTATVKDEVESDEEDDEAGGQTSIDLALDKPEIRQLLSTTSPADSDSTTTDAVIKQETEENEGSLLDERSMLMLVPILDKSRSWEKIAKSFGYEFLESSLRNSSSSPSRMLLTYMDLRADVPIEQLRSLLAKLGETEAVEIIDEMISRRKNSE